MSWMLGAVTAPGDGGCEGSGGSVVALIGDSDTNIYHIE